MKILSSWLREYVPGLTASDRQLADDLTLRGIAVEGVFDLKAPQALTSAPLSSRWTSPPTASTP